MRSQYPGPHWGCSLPRCPVARPTHSAFTWFFTDLTLQIHFNIFVTLEGSINISISTRSIHAATVGRRVASRALHMPLWTRISYLYIYCIINIIPQPILYVLFFRFFSPAFFFWFPRQWRSHCSHSKPTTNSADQAMT